MGAGSIVWRGIAICGLVSACGRVGFDGLDDGVPDDGGAVEDGNVADAAIPASCVGLAPTCGPTGTDSCCESPVVPGGTFFRGYDGVGYDDQSYPATVGAFRLDKYEVTVGRFRQFVQAGSGTQQSPPAAGDGAHGAIPGWDPAWNANLAPNTATLSGLLQCNQTQQQWTATAGANESLPLGCVTWYDAMAFCAWDGGFLPTEAEWLFAFHGGDEQRAYPWSVAPQPLAIDCTHANHYTGATHCVNPPNGFANRVGSESPAGDGRWGQSDLAGNIWEWNRDSWFGSYTNPCVNCAYLGASSDVVIRGGAYYDWPNALRGGYRFSRPPSARIYGYGFRCARAP